MQLYLLAVDSSYPPLSDFFHSKFLNNTQPSKGSNHYKYSNGFNDRNGKNIFIELIVYGLKPVTTSKVTAPLSVKYLYRIMPLLHCIDPPSHLEQYSSPPRLNPYSR